MFRIPSRYQDLALDCTLFATGLTANAAACTSAVSILNRHFGTSVGAAAGAIAGPAAIIGTIAYVNLIHKVPLWLRKDSLQKVRWKFFGIGTLATAVTSFAALRVFKGSPTLHASWGSFGVGLQAVLCLAVGMVYTRLVNNWAMGLLSNPLTQWKPERIRDVAAGIDDHELLKIACTTASAWKKPPIFLIIEEFPAERLESFLRVLLQKNTSVFLWIFEYVLLGRTHFNPAHINRWVRRIVESIDNVPLDKIKMYCEHEFYFDKQTHILALVEAYRQHNNLSIVDLQAAFQQLVFDREEEFLDCTSWDVQQLSNKTIDDLFVMLTLPNCSDQFRRCVLHLMNKDAERQIQILNMSPLGSHYIYHTNRPANNSARFHYPRLAEGTIDDLMKKQTPTVWDLAICARQREGLREQLAKLSPQDLLPLADFRGSKETGCAADYTSCWDNELCWNNSLIKVVFEALPADKRESLLPELKERRSVWKRFAKALILNEKPEKEAKALLEWTMINAEELKRIYKNLQPTTYKIAYLPIFLLGPIWNIFPYIKTRLVFTEGGCWTLDFPPDTTVFKNVPTDVFNMICQKYLYPADRICLAETCRALRYRIYSEKGQRIWNNEGSIRAALRMQELSNMIEATENFTDNQVIINKILARVWPRNFWPASKKPKWIKAL